jgi:hypothetical protein
MALRSTDEIGVRDPRRISPVLVDDGTTKPGPTTTRSKVRAARTGPNAEKAGEVLRQGFEQRIIARAASDADAASVAATPALGSEPTDYIQVNVPGDLQHRMETVAFEMSEAHPRLAKHQLILGALLWRYVSFEDEDSLRALAELMERYSGGEYGEAPLDRRLAARVPASLKRQARGAALRLRRTQDDASLRLIVSALVAEHVRSQSDSPQEYEKLVATVASYRQALK